MEPLYRLTFGKAVLKICKIRSADSLMNDLPIIRNLLLYSSRFIKISLISMIFLSSAFSSEFIQEQVADQVGSDITPTPVDDCAVAEKCNREAEELIKMMTSDYYNNLSKTDSEPTDLKSMPRAKIIVLNKITAKSEEAVLNIGEIKYFGNLSVQIHKCLKNIDPYAVNSLMLISVFEDKVEEENLSVFQGWLVSSNPSISTTEHPVYEVIARDCF